MSVLKLLPHCIGTHASRKFIHTYTQKTRRTRIARFSGSGEAPGKPPEAFLATPNQRVVESWGKFLRGCQKLFLATPNRKIFELWGSSRVVAGRFRATLNRKIFECWGSSQEAAGCSPCDPRIARLSGAGEIPGKPPVAIGKVLIRHQGCRFCDKPKDLHAGGGCARPDRFTNAY